MPKPTGSLKTAPSGGEASGESPGARVRSPAAWSQLVGLLGTRRRLVIVLVVGSIMSGLAESGVLALVAQAAAALVAGSSHVTLAAGLFTVHASVETLLWVGIGLAVIRFALQGIVSVAPARIAADIQAQLRDEVFTAFTRASWAEQSRDLEGHLQEVLTNQVTSAIWGTIQATVLVVTGVSFLVLVISALLLNALAALIVVAAAMVLFVLIRPLSNLGRREAQAVSRALMSYAGGINETVRIAEEMHVFGTGAPQRDQMRLLLGNVTSPFFRSQMVARLVPGIYQSLMYLLVVVTLLALYLSGAGHVAALGGVVLLLIRAGAYGQQAQAAQQVVRQALPYLEPVYAARDRYLAASESSGTRRVTEVESLAFEAVSYGYTPQHRVLRDVSFTVARHESLGIIGPSGAGKSTLIQLMLRLRAPDEGRYLVNGLPAAEVAANDWHRLVAYVPQEPRLLHASVAENIRFRRPISDAAVQRAAQLAGIHDDIMMWSDGYDTLIGPRADAVSGGQKQRITLARALAAEPELLVLDEPTSSLDPRSEQAIKESLDSLRSQLTLVVIAHRLSTLSMCDRIVVLVGGEVEALAPLESLSNASPYYRSVSAIAASHVTDPASTLLQDPSAARR